MVTIKAITCSILRYYILPKYCCIMHAMYAENIGNMSTLPNDPNVIDAHNDNLLQPSKLA